MGDGRYLVHKEPCQGPHPKIEREWVKVALHKMKDGKAVGTSGIAAEMLKVADDIGLDILTDLCNTIIQANSIPSRWDVSIILNCFKGEGAALDRSNYRGLKLIKHALKVFERVIENLLGDKVDIGSMQFGFMPGKGTTDAIFVVRQAQERFMDKKRPILFAFVDLEKAFDRVPRAVLEWSLRELIVDDWLIKVIMPMYKNARSLVRVSGKLGEEFEVEVGVHQGSVLSPILFAIVLEILSRGFSAGLPWELLYADDLVIMADSLDELSVKLERWKAELSAKGLKVNTKKTKIMISKPGASPVQKTGKYPCSVCSKGVGSNSIQCTKCKQWIHARCSRVKGKLAKVKDFVCNSSSSPPLDTCEEEENIVIGNSSYEAV